MAIVRAISPLLQYKISQYNTKPEGWLLTFLSGTKTPVCTYKNPNGDLNETAIHLNYRGECDVWLDSDKTYRFELWNESRTEMLWRCDNVTAPGVGVNTDVIKWSDVQAVQDSDYSEFVTRIAADIEAGIVPVVLDDVNNVVATLQLSDTNPAIYRFATPANQNSQWREYCITASAVSSSVQTADGVLENAQWNNASQNWPVDTPTVLDFTNPVTLANNSFHYVKVTSSPGTTPINIETKWPEAVNVNIKLEVDVPGGISTITFNEKVLDPDGETIANNAILYNIPDSQDDPAYKTFSSGTYYVRITGNTVFVELDDSQVVMATMTQNFDSTQKSRARSNIGAASASDVSSLQTQVESLSNVSAYTVKGEATVAQLNDGPSDIQAGWTYQLTDSGTLTDGSLAVIAGDSVAWDGTKWFPLIPSQQLENTPIAEDVGGYYDFAIVDNQNNILAMFKDGGIVVKNGGVSTTAKTGTDCDFAIVDNQNNILAMFKDGGIKTSKFDSDTIINLDEKSFVDFRSETTAREFFEITNGTFSNNGMVLSAGWSNAILSKKHFSFQDETLTFVVDVSDSDTIIYFGSRETLKIKTGSYGSCFKVDFSNHIIGLLVNDMFDNDPLSVPYKFSDNSVDFSTWTKVILTLKRSERIISARLTNYYTSEYVEVTSNNTTSVGNYDGELYDSIFLASSEDLTIENFSFDVPTHTDVLFVGDSVSDGRGVLIDDSWPRKFGEYLGCRCCYAPRAGGRASTCVAFLSDWLGFIKPRVVVCSIGVNGGNTTEDFDEIVSLCKQANALLVLNTIYNAASSFTNISAIEWNTYNSYILGVNCLHIRFDIASSANKEAPIFNALDSDYTMVDNVHPAAGGHQMLYERAVVDAGQIKNLFL